VTSLSFALACVLVLFSLSLFTSFSFRFPFSFSFPFISLFLPRVSSMSDAALYLYPLSNPLPHLPRATPQKIGKNVSAGFRYTPQIQTIKTGLLSPILPSQDTWVGYNQGKTFWKSFSYKSKGHLIVWICLGNANNVLPVVVFQFQKNLSQTFLLSINKFAGLTAARQALTSAMIPQNLPPCGGNRLELLRRHK